MHLGADSGAAMYIVTAWDDHSETTVRARDPAIALARATALVSQGMKITIIRTATGESLAITELKEEIDRARGIVGTSRPADVS